MTNELLGDVDVLFGVDAADFDDTIAELVSELPGLSVVATTRRVVRSASVHDWGGVGWSRSGGTIEGTHYPGLDVLDRVGGGDGFASGLIYGLLDGRPLADALELGIAHGALVMTTPGDTSSVDLADVERLVSGHEPVGDPLNVHEGSCDARGVRIRDDRPQHLDRAGRRLPPVGRVRRDRRGPPLLRR